MKREIWLNSGFSAATEDGRLVEYLPKTESAQAGDILRGKVERMMPGLRCVFVDIGRKRAGFLPMEEDSESFTGGPLRSGDTISVQIRKEETGGKGVRLTRDLTLPGRTVILMPRNRHIGVSARITDDAARARLTEFGRTLAGGRFGLVLRAAAEQAEAHTIREETEALWEEWQETEAREQAVPAPGLLWAAPDDGKQLLNDYEARGISRVHRDEPLSADLCRQLREAGKRCISLPHGGTIVIDRCEAMTVIDVNTAGESHGRTRRETILETNLEAAAEIAVQARLRSLGGILMIDMINMDSGTDQSLVLEALKKAFEPDRVKTVIYGYTALGLIEMTRKRTRAALAEAPEKADGKDEA